MCVDMKSKNSHRRISNSDKLKKKTKVATNHKKSRKRKKRNHKRKVPIFLTLLLAILCVVVVYASLFFLFFRLGTMEGDSMYPIVSNKNSILVNKYATIKRFDLVYMYNPLNKEELTIKRVIGLPNESVDFNQDELLINGEEKSEPYLEEKKKMYPGVTLTEDFKSSDVIKSSAIPKDSYFVLGDNRKKSVDSRVYGYVDETLIIGKVTMRVYPFTSFTIF